MKYLVLAAALCWGSLAVADDICAYFKSSGDLVTRPNDEGVEEVIIVDAGDLIITPEGVEFPGGRLKGIDWAVIGLKQDTTIPPSTVNISEIPGATELDPEEEGGDLDKRADNLAKAAALVQLDYINELRGKIRQHTAETVGTFPDITPAELKAAVKAKYKSIQ